MRDYAYFAAIDEEMRCNGREALLDFFLKLDISKVNLREIPKTAALLEQKIASATPEQAWLLDTLKQGELPWGTDDPRTCPKKRLFNRYLTHATRRGVSRRSAETMLGMFLASHVPGLESVRQNYEAYDGGLKVIKRGSLYRFPPLSKCRAAFADMLQQKIDWGGDDGDEWQHDDERIEKDDDEIPF
jgi:hypothetical protein